MNGPPTLIDMTDYEKGHTALHKAAAYKRRTICCMLGNKKPIINFIFQFLDNIFYISVTAGANLIIEDSSGKFRKERIIFELEKTGLGRGTNL